MATETPRDLFFDQLRDLHSVESQLTASYPTLVARDPYASLAALLAKQAEDCRSQKESAESIFEAHGVEIGDDECLAMKGLIQGGDRHLDSVQNAETKDLMMVAHCLRISHYKLAAYGITLRLAAELELREEATALGAILRREKAALHALEELEPRLFERAQEDLVA